MAILGMWMWPQNVQRYGAEHVVSICARAGVTDLYFLTKGLAGTAAYHSAYAPHSCKRDLLREVIDAAHPRGIRVHAWFTSASDAFYKQQHPQSGRSHFTRGKDKDLISLADAGYLTYMETLMAELCTGWAIDGLHLDYIRYNHLLYGWDEKDIARYAEEGADIAHLRNLVERTCLQSPAEETCIFDALRAGDASAAAFARTRRKDVYRFANTLTAAARASRPDLILSAALMPEGAYADTAFADVHYGQSYEDAAALYDYALPMAYSKAYEKDAAWVRAVAEGTLRHGVKTIMGLHAYEGGTGLSLRADADALSDTPVDGICLFREGAAAMGFAAGRTLCIYNPLAVPITGVIAEGRGQRRQLDAAISPGSETCFPLPFETDTVRVFTGETEACVYLAKG